jgi:hypothetical protein
VAFGNVSQLQPAIGPDQHTLTFNGGMEMKRLSGAYWQAIFFLLTITALILAVGAPESLPW